MGEGAIVSVRRNQEIFDTFRLYLSIEIKKYLIPPVLIPPQQGKPFRLYLSIDGMFIGLALIQESEGKERVIYYLSRRLVDAETRYSAIEKLCLCLYFSCIKLRHYLLSAECTVICKDDVV